MICTRHSSQFCQKNFELAHGWSYLPPYFNHLQTNVVYIFNIHKFQEPWPCYYMHALFSVSAFPLYYLDDFIHVIASMLFTSTEIGVVQLAVIPLSAIECLWALFLFRRNTIVAIVMKQYTHGYRSIARCCNIYLEYTSQHSHNTFYILILTVFVCTKVNENIFCRMINEHLFLHGHWLSYFAIQTQTCWSCNIHVCYNTHIVFDDAYKAICH